MVYVLGVLSAFFYGLASVLQHREASAAPQGQSLRLGLLAHLLKRPMWAAGIAADAAAFVLQGSALSRGPLVLVQPLLTAFQAGRLELSLPALPAVAPVASSAVGVILFSEHIRSDPVALALETVAAALIVFGIWVLGRSPTVTGGQGSSDDPSGQAQTGQAQTGQAQSLPSRNAAETGA